jgi:hypothetical protein
MGTVAQGLGTLVQCYTRAVLQRMWHKGEGSSLEGAVCLFVFSAENNFVLLDAVSCRVVMIHDS